MDLEDDVFDDKLLIPSYLVNHFTLYLDYVNNEKSKFFFLSQPISKLKRINLDAEIDRLNKISENSYHKYLYAFKDILDTFNKASKTYDIPEPFPPDYNN